MCIMNFHKENMKFRVSQINPFEALLGKAQVRLSPLLEEIVRISGHQGGGRDIIHQSHNGEASVYARYCYLPNIPYCHVILSRHTFLFPNYRYENC